MRGGFSSSASSRKRRRGSASAPAETELCLASDDAFDALVAALVARAVAAGLVEPIPGEERAAARKEGWIAVPREGSLERLALALTRLDPDRPNFTGEPYYGPVHFSRSVLLAVP